MSYEDLLFGGGTTEVAVEPPGTALTSPNAALPPAGSERARFLVWSCRLAYGALLPVFSQ